MKKTYILFICIICSIAILGGSCKKDILNVAPQGELSDDAVWSDPILVQAFVNNIYKRQRPSIMHSYLWEACFIDEATSWANERLFQNSLHTPDDLGGYEGRLWDVFYGSIRACNIFFSRIDELETSEEEKDNMKGQVHFLRAMNYQELLKTYGGVPIIDKAYTLEDSFLVARNTYEECVNFIVADCDAAAALLPEVQPDLNLGQATKGAALTLKSKTLLYAASDLHNTNKFSSFSNPELLQYAGGDRTARWTAAKNAAKAVIDLNLYSLYMPDPAPGDNITNNFISRYLSKGNSEDIWIRYFLAKNRESNPMQSSGPPGFNGFGHNQPTGTLVDSYEMIDGTRFDWNNPVHAAAPYENRDPRFYADILYEGAKWRMRPASLVGVDPIGVVQVGDKEVWRNNQVEFNRAFDGPKGPIAPWNATHTGYYLRKFVDPGVEAGKFASDVPWRYYRYAEIILNYAEACMELGQEAEARTYLNMIRKRAGMPDITESGQALKDRYRNERRIELAFEEHRFWDVRRWIIGEEAYVPIGGVSVIYKLLPDHTTSPTPTITPIVGQIRAWDDKSYFLPILRDEMNKNYKLVQNPGYN